MIYKNSTEFPDDIDPSDAPPSYETLHDTRPSSSAVHDTKAPIVEQNQGSGQDGIGGSPGIRPEGFGSKGKGKAPSSWWGSFGMSRTSREVRTTVLGIIRDVVKEYSNADESKSSAARSILSSCAEACAGQGILFSSLLQEKSIEGHTPIYWAIINRPLDSPSPSSAGSSDLLMSLLSFSAPLEPVTLSEIRLACLNTSDQALFQRLRLSPEFAPLSGTDQMVLRGTIPDEVEVVNVPGDEGAFVVDLKLMQFQKRMKVSKEVGVEFIARGRMWKLAFCVSQKDHVHHTIPRTGTWYIQLSLLENSPPTWIDSRILIPDASLNVPPPGDSSLLDIDSQPSPSTPVPASTSFFGSLAGRASQPKPKPTISLRLQARDQLSAANKSSFHQSSIHVPLENSLMANSLQYAGSSYIGADDSLRARLEAKLAKPEAECVIC
ncbi:hypothetical protein Moror_9312 [Moniliophthora roreri MCA 2997]|uniref:Uncharacterized protein n=2 Tax=Moniliophthora roreri TaxID=221103 RepID=V2WX54_MONRO|nr:hypothetical protein Moror_9312 [Moniliophthora roreri MCA 2997]KAI3605479.1 hypothetical protein WG66_005953 [Moniliophthora roreri]